MQNADLLSTKKTSFKILLNGSVYISCETLPLEAGRTVTLSTPAECIGILRFTPLNQNKIKVSFMKNAEKRCSYIIKLKYLYISILSTVNIDIGQQKPYCCS